MSYFLLMACCSFAQHQNDLVLTSGLRFERKISRSFSAILNTQYSFNQNLEELGYHYYDLGVMYKYNSHFSGEFHYRYIKFRNLENFYDDRQMPYIDLSYSKSRKNFSFELRTRFQETFYGLHFAPTYRPPSIYNRNKFIVSYHVNYYISPYASLEIYYPLNNSSLRKKINQWRETIGIYYTFNRYYRIEAYYQVQDLTNRIHKLTNYVMGVTGYYRF